MDEYDALMAAVIAEPADAAPRLVLADWLEEQGTPEARDQAAFIRAQVELDAFESWDSLSSGLQRRASSLLERHLKRWAGSRAVQHPRDYRSPETIFECTVGPVFGDEDRWLFGRGLLESAEMTAAEFLNHGQEITSRTPLRCLKLAELNTHALEVGHQSRLQKLLQQGNIPESFIEYEEQRLAELEERPTLRQIGNSPWIARVESLSFDWETTRFDDEDAAALASCSGLEHLQGLRLNMATHATASSAVALAKGPWRQLRDLELQGESEEGMSDPSELNDEGAIAIAQSDLSNQIERLVLRFADCGDDGAAAIGSIEGLREVDLCGNPISDAGIDRLVAGACSAHLRTLNIAGCRLTANALTAMNKLCALRRLNIERQQERSRIDTAALAENLQQTALLSLTFDLVETVSPISRFCEARQFRSLRELIVGVRAAGDVKSIANSDVLSNLVSLSISNDGDLDQELAYIAESETLANLHSLRVFSIFCPTDALMKLAQAVHFRRLTHLEVAAFCRLTEQDAETLASSPVIQQLCALRLSCEKEAKEVLRERLGARFMDV